MATMAGISVLDRFTKRLGYCIGNFVFKAGAGAIRIGQVIGVRAHS